MTATVSAGAPELTVYLSDPPAVQRNASLQDVVYGEEEAWNSLYPTLISKRAHIQLVVRKSSPSTNARAAIESDGLIAYLGEVQNGQSAQTVGITNFEDALELSPTDTVDPTENDYENHSSFGRTFASLPIDLGTSLSALTQAGPTGWRTTFESDFRHAPAPEAIEGYDSVDILLRVLAYLGNNANNRSDIVRDTIATLKANRGRASVAAFTIKK